jgi:hypothetical protein
MQSHISAAGSVRLRCTVVEQGGQDEVGQPRSHVVRCPEFLAWEGRPFSSIPTKKSQFLFTPRKMSPKLRQASLQSSRASLHRRRPEPTPVGASPRPHLGQVGRAQQHHAGVDALARVVVSLLVVRDETLLFRKGDPNRFESVVEIT